MLLEEKVKKIFGFQTLSKEGVGFLEKWESTPEELVVEALKITKENIHKASFSYADAVLDDWKKNNLTTVEDVRKHAKKFDRKRSGGNGNKVSSGETVKKEDVLRYIRKIQKDMPQYMQSKAEKAGFVNACCQIGAFVEALK